MIIFDKFIGELFEIIINGPIPISIITSAFRFGNIIAYFKILSQVIYQSINNLRIRKNTT
jgi:hypothetical protein